MSAPGLSIVIPAYNEAEALPHCLDRIRTAFAGSGRTIEVIVLSDGSSDATFDVGAAALGDMDGRIVEFARNTGSHAAIRCGLELSSGDLVAVISADGQDPPELLPQLAQRIDDNPSIEIAWGRRSDRSGDSRSGRTVAGAYYRLFRLLTRLDYPSAGLDFLVMSRRVRDTIVAHGERNLPLFLTVFNLGFGQAFVDYERGARVAGSSGWTTRKRLKMAGDMLIAVSAAPLRLMSVIGGIVGLAGLLFGLVTILRAVLGQTPDSGWASLMTAISVMGGTILIGISVLGEYVWRTLDEARGRPLYVIARDSLGHSDEGPHVSDPR